MSGASFSHSAQSPGVTWTHEVVRASLLPLPQSRCSCCHLGSDQFCLLIGAEIAGTESWTLVEPEEAGVWFSSDWWRMVPAGLPPSQPNSFQQLFSWLCKLNQRSEFQSELSVSFCQPLNETGSLNKLDLNAYMKKICCTVTFLHEIAESRTGSYDQNILQTWTVCRNFNKK